MRIFMHVLKVVFCFERIIEMMLVVKNVGFLVIRMW
jgi:hypothetical protein